MKKHWLIIVILIGLVSCTKQYELYKFKNSNKISDSVGTPVDKAVFYYPIEKFIDSTCAPGDRIAADGSSVSNEKVKWHVELDTFIVKLFSEKLFKLSEPILYNRYLNKEIYRIVVSYSFFPDMVFRIERTGDSITLVSKSYFEHTSSILDSVATVHGLPLNYTHTVLDSISIKQSTKKIPLKSWNDFENLLTKNKFQAKPTTIAMDFGPDGGIIIIERHCPQGYYVVKRSSFGSGYDDLERISDFLINLSGLKP